MAVAVAERVSFSYPHAGRPALDDVSLRLEAGEKVALLGPSGSGKSTLVRALGGLVPHFHGGSFSGRVTVAGLDTRRTRPADIAGCVATVFQDPEDQIVMGVVRNEVAFGLENVGAQPAEIEARAEEALALVGALHLADRRTAELSGGELQRVCLASALALRPSLLLLDEPTSQLDPEAAESFVERLGALGAAVLLSEQRVERALAFADRALFLDEGQVRFDGSRDAAQTWLAEHRPGWVEPLLADAGPASSAGRPVLEIDAVSFSYSRVPVLEAVDLVVRRGEVVVLEGPNGSGKTTLAKLAAGLLEPAGGSVRRDGRACYLSQDPGRYLVRDRVDEEVALAVGGDIVQARAALARVGLGWAAAMHPRDLSSGERERLGVAAVTVSEPDLLVLDEPTRGVDPDRKRALATWLGEYAAGGRGVLVATHDRTFPASRRIRLRSGEVTLAAS